MHIDVHQGGFEFEVERGDGMAVAGEEVGVGGAQRALQQPVAHRPSVHEQVLVGAVAAVEGRHAGVADQAHLVTGLVDGQRIVRELGAQDRPEPRQPPGHA